MKKILFLIPTLGHGGAERVLVNLVNHMDSQKFNITVQTLFDVGIYQTKLNKSIRYIGGFKWYFRGNTILMKFFSPSLLYKFFIRECYDIIISYLEGSAARILSGCDDPLTQKIAWIHIEQETKKRAAASFRSFEEACRCYGKFDHIVCVSRSVQKDFSRIFPNISSQVIYNTIESDVILQKSKEPLTDLQFDKNEINICSVAKLMKSKGFDRLVRITQKLVNEGYPVHVYILGIGDEKNYLEKMIEEYHIGKSWTFLGFRDNPYKYVAAADLYVCCSRREGFSTAVAEALIVGTPVVSTSCSGAKELLGENNEYGIVTANTEEDLLNGIRKIIAREDLLKHYREMSKERSKYFNLAQSIISVENLLDRK